MNVAIGPTNDDLLVADHTARSQSEIESWMKSKLASVLDLEADDIDVHEEFAAYGLDSVSAISLIGELSEWLDLELSSTMLWDHPTIASASSRLAEMSATGESPIWSPLVPLRANGSAPPLFLIHESGGYLLFYRDLVDRLSDDIPVYGIQSTLLNPDNETPDSVEELAAVYAAQIRSVQAKGPYHLAAMCFGSVIALELAQQLTDSGESVDMLCVVEPSLPRVDKTRDGGSTASIVGRAKRHWKMRQFSAVLVTYLKDHLVLFVREPKKRFLDFFWQSPYAHWLREHYKKRAGTTNYNNRRAKHLHLQLEKKYRAKPYRGRIVRFVSDDEARNDKRERLQVSAWSWIGRDSFANHIIRGEHFTILKPPYVNEVVKKLETELRS